MLEELSDKQVNKIKKLASHGKAGLFFATLKLAILLASIRIWKMVKSPLFRLISIIILAAGSLVITSFNPVNRLSVENVIDTGDYGPLIQDELLDESEYVKTEVNEDDEMASLDDLINSRVEEHIEPSPGASVTASKDSEAEPVTFDKSEWNLLLVNKEHPIPADYTFTLGVIKGSMKCDERILGPLTDMFTGANEDGINLVVCSPYRDLSRQEYLFDRKMKAYINSGYSYIDAYKASSAVVTVPGASEHQIGLSLDIICDTYSQLNDGFGETAAGKWLVDNSYKYGFILRYPKDKEEITGIIYEPWHFRYVGIPAATIIHENNLTLEEFVDSI